MTGKVIEFPAQKPPTQGATCGCGSQEFMLIVPNEVYCPHCQCICTRLRWDFIEEPPNGSAA